MSDTPQSPPGGSSPGSMGLNMEHVLVAREISEIIRLHNQCVDRLKAYRETYPYLIAPNVAHMLEGNLKENVQMLLREMNNLHKPRQQQRRHACAICHNVFTARLPGGVCDECRSKVGVPDPFGRTDDDREPEAPSDTAEPQPEDPENLLEEEAAPQPDEESRPE